MKQCYWSATGIPKIDYSPLEERWATLEGIFEAQERKHKTREDKKSGDVFQKNFITYFIGKHDEDQDKTEKVRVNGKYSPKDTKVGVPANM